MAPKPSNQEVLAAVASVMEAVQSLNVGMGAELVALRGEVDKLNLTITGLSHMLANAVVKEMTKSIVGTQPIGPQPLFYSGQAIKVGKHDLNDMPSPAYTSDDIYNGCMPLNALEKDYAKSGAIVECVKEYRMRIHQLTGTIPSLKASKDLADAYKNKGQYASVPLDSTYTSDQIINAKVPLNAAEIKLACKAEKVAAIIGYRLRIQALTGIMPGLKETKDMVEAYVLAMPSKPAFDAANPLPVPPECNAFILAGKKIDAIKFYREYTMAHCCVGGHAGLKEAKDVIDSYIASFLKLDPYNLPGVSETI